MAALACALERCEPCKGAPVLEAEESLVLRQPATSLLVGGDKAGASGTLFVTTRRLVWFPDSGAAGVDVPFQRIIMHAIARDAAACPRPCIFAQVEGATVEASQADEEEEEEEDDEPRSTELRLVPADEAALEALFHTMCDVAAMNPDPQVEGDGDDMFFDEEEVQAGAQEAVRAAALERLDEMLLNDPARFEDDDEEYEEEEEEEEVGNGHTIQQ